MTELARCKDCGNYLGASDYEEGTVYPTCCVVCDLDPICWRCRIERHEHVFEKRSGKARRDSDQPAEYGPIGEPVIIELPEARWSHPWALICFCMVFSGCALGCSLLFEGLRSWMWP